MPGARGGTANLRSAVPNEGNLGATGPRGGAIYVGV